MTISHQRRVKTILTNKVQRAFVMHNSYKCDKCNNQFPDKETATEHRNATGHPLSLVTLQDR
ncbi:MAG TPA: hypothetical protein VH500_07690 [Nitrososphaeraceae archaeon]